MESDQFENLLKEKLEERRLRPSSEAWQRISAHKKSAKQKPFGWMALAAAVLIAVGLFFIMPGKEIPVQEKVTYQPVPQTKLRTGLPKITTLPSDTEKIVVEHHETVVLHNKQPLIPETKPENTPIIISKEEQKVDEILASLEKLKDGGDNITESTLDSLLSNARRELALEKQVNAPTNAQALLRETEAELDMSFKDRVFAAISRFKKIKIALGSDQP